MPVGMTMEAEEADRAASITNSFLVVDPPVQALPPEDFLFSCEAAGIFCQIGQFGSMLSFYFMD